MSVRLLNLGSGIMAAAATGGLFAALVTGSVVLALVAVACAVNCALLQGLAYTRAAGSRFDAIVDRASAYGRPAKDNTGGWP